MPATSRICTTVCRLKRFCSESATASGEHKISLLQLLQSYHSYCDSLRRQRFSTIVGKFHEIRHFSFPKSNIRAGVISITPDLVNAEYPLVVVQRALYRMYGASGMSVWRKLCTDMPMIMNVVEHLMFDPPRSARPPGPDSGAPMRQIDPLKQA
jgi:hypothetical protein